MTDLLTRLKGKLSEQATIEYRLKKSDEREQERIIDTLIGEIHGDVRTSSAVRSFNLEYGLPPTAVISPLLSSRIFHQHGRTRDGVHAMMKHALEIVRQELGQLKCGFAAAIRREGVAVAVYLPEYQPVEVKQCFTKIRKEIEKQRDLFWGTVRQSASAADAPLPMRLALLCARRSGCVSIVCVILRSGVMRRLISLIFTRITRWTAAVSAVFRKPPNI